MKHLFYAGAFFLSALMLSCGNGGKSSEANDSLTKQAARAKYQAAVDSVEKLLHSGKSYDQRLATA
ncbi:MAG TPA: hypothetical protein VFU15_16695, partial [Bacteroidia bacterium]|nr:hypothetical protein [Bacteroidia bacterium]